MRRSFSGSVGLASLAAGPIFIVSTGLAAAYLQLPHAIIVDPHQIVPILLFFLPALIVGWLLSVIPNLIGSRLLHFTGGAIPATRARLVWTGAGALIGAAIAGSFGAFAEPAYAFGLIVTSACCAAICRLSAYWD